MSGVHLRFEQRLLPPTQPRRVPVLLHLFHSRPDQQALEYIHACMACIVVEMLRTLTPFYCADCLFDIRPLTHHNVDEHLVTVRFELLDEKMARDWMKSVPGYITKCFAGTPILYQRTLDPVEPVLTDLKHGGTLVFEVHEEALLCLAGDVAKSAPASSTVSLHAAAARVFDQHPTATIRAARAVLDRNLLATRPEYARPFQTACLIARKETASILNRYWSDEVARDDLRLQQPAETVDTIFKAHAQGECIVQAHVLYAALTAAVNTTPTRLLDSYAFDEHGVRDGTSTISKPLRLTTPLAVSAADFAFYVRVVVGELEAYERARRFLQRRNFKSAGVSLRRPQDMPGGNCEQVPDELRAYCRTIQQSETDRLRR